MLSAHALLLVAAAVSATGGSDVAGRHVGVSACASALCHGAVDRWEGSRVRQDEYRVWRDRDRHARAFEALRGEAARRITDNLGWDAATTDARCVACHSDDASRRGPELRVEDGVGCEACHGGAGAWLESHATAAATHRDNLDRGMAPIDEPERRAELCLSCHFGTSRKFVTHAMLAAGHPRLRFELDTYTQNEPAHFVVDDGYRARKQGPTSAQLWAVGQGVALREYLTALGERGAAGGGSTDYALLDCAACHHAVGAQPVTSAAPNPRVGLPRLDAASFLMFRRALGVLDGAAAEHLARDLGALGQAMSQRGLRPPPTLGGIRDRVGAGVARVAAWTPEPATLGALLTALLATDGDPTYLVAEQQAMAIQSVVASTPHADACAASMNRALDRLFAAARPAGFETTAFRAALADVARARCE